MNQSDPVTAFAPPALNPTYWPRVLGVIGIIFALTALSHGAMVLLIPNASQLAYQEMKIAVPEDFFTRHWVAIKLLPGLGGLLGMLLLIGSILLLLRKRVSRVLLLVWAGIKICFAIGQAPAMSALQHEILPIQLKALAESKPETQAVLADASALEGMISVAMVVGVAWLCCFPVFHLIWLNRAKIRTEISGWSN